MRHACSIAIKHTEFVVITCPFITALLGTCLQFPAPTPHVTDATAMRYEWRASTYTPSAQEEHAIAPLPDGGIVSVWSSRRQNGGYYGVYAQCFDRDGVAIGSEIAVSSLRNAHATAPAIAVAPDGTCWVAWSSASTAGSEIRVVSFDRAFQRGAEAIISAAVAGQHAGPVLAVGESGDVLVAWTAALNGERTNRIAAQWLDRDGNRIGRSILVAGDERTSARTPAIAIRGVRQAAIAYALFDESGDPSGVLARELQDYELAEAIRLSEPAADSPIEPVIAARCDDFVVAWLQADAEADYDVWMCTLPADANRSSVATRVNTTLAGSQSAAAIAVTDDKSFAIAWNSREAKQVAICGQLFGAEGTPMGDEFVLKSAATRPHGMTAARATSRLIFSSDGRLTCAWNGNLNDIDKNSANITMISPQPIVLAGREQGVRADMLAAAPLAEPQVAEPHEPPTFDPNFIAEGTREFVRGIEDFGFTGVTTTGWTPPDPYMAVGPDHVVIMTNGAIAFFQKDDGTKDHQEKIEGRNGFWGSKGATDFIFDPEVLYDPESGRFFAMAAEGYAPGNKSYVLIAVSDDSDPNGTWYKYRFETTKEAGNLFDSPNIAVDSQAVYITGDAFGKGAAYPIYTFDKESLLAGNDPATRKTLSLDTQTLSAGIPPVSFDNPPALYMIEHSEADPADHVRLIALTDPLGSPALTDYELTVPKYSPPEDPPQKGTSTRPETFDQRFWSCAYHNGSLWATHHVNSSNVVARWYEIAMNGWPESDDLPTLVQSGEIAPAKGIRTFFSAITVDDNGGAALVYARSSTVEYMNMATSQRFRSDASGTFRGTLTRKSSTSPDDSGRWGDYCAINVDPTDGRTFWAVHEYRENTGWKTWIQRFSPPYPPGDMDCDGVVSFNDIDPFVLALSDPDGYAAEFPACDILHGDLDADGVVTFLDIDPFVELLGG